MSSRVVVVSRPHTGLFAGVRSLPRWLGAIAGATSRALVRSGAEVDADGESERGAEGSATAADPAGSAAFEALLAALAERGVVGIEPPPCGLSSSSDAVLLRIAAGEAHETLRWLARDAPIRFDLLNDLMLVDRWPAAPRFEADYVLRTSAARPALASPTLCVRVALEDVADPAAGAPELDSVASLFRSADWLEREAAELFGVRLRGHPGLQPLLLPPGFVGAPLRRDFVAEPGQ